MVINRCQIDDYIKCPYLFGKNVLYDKYNTSRLSEPYNKFKKYLNEVALYELKELQKKSLAEYRAGYTNISCKKIDVLDSHVLITKLNNVFSLFYDNIFVGYNVPADIIIPGTSTIFRHMFDYILINEKKTRVTAVEIANLDGKVEFYKAAFQNWAHYYTAYSYLSYKFKKPVSLIILDPIKYEKIRIDFNSKMFEDDLVDLSNLIVPINSEYLYKNLYYCHCENGCEYLGVC
ncbi:MAG: hypothetical protein RBR68_07260 [Tenuifilaceae bacterium]|nr:hypothetical protein [Tenuifilaceae bacterium]